MRVPSRLTGERGFSSTTKERASRNGWPNVRRHKRRAVICEHRAASPVPGDCVSHTLRNMVATIDRVSWPASARLVADRAGTAADRDGGWQAGRKIRSRPQRFQRDPNIGSSIAPQWRSPRVWRYYRRKEAFRSALRARDGVIGENEYGSDIAVDSDCRLTDPGSSASYGCAKGVSAYGAPSPRSGEYVRASR